jgi:hypothetical protein
VCASTTLLSTLARLPIVFLNTNKTLIAVPREVDGAIYLFVCLFIYFCNTGD